MRSTLAGGRSPGVHPHSSEILRGFALYIRLIFRGAYHVRDTQAKIKRVIEPPFILSYLMRDGNSVNLIVTAAVSS